MRAARETALPLHLDRMIRSLVAATILAVTSLPAQHPGFTGPPFLALSVPDLEAATHWYQRAFGPFAVRDLPAPDSTVRTRLLQGAGLMIELSWHQRARALRDYAGGPTPTFLVHGAFKSGWFVGNLDSTVSELRRRDVTIGNILTDSAAGLRWVLFRDTSGHFIQLLERRRP